MDRLPDEPPRWLYRYEHFHSAFTLLREACADYAIREFSDLEKEGLVGRFSFTWELSWKLLKDYLQYLGVSLEAIAPRTVIRAAVAADLISDASVWMQALESRNAITHMYSGTLRDAVVANIVDRYVDAFASLDQLFDGRRQS